MVLGIRLSLPLTALAAACSAAAPPQAETQQATRGAGVQAVDGVLDGAVIAGTRLDLITGADGCVLRVGDKTKPLDLGQPCRFLRNRPGAEPARYDYGDRGSVVLVAGPPAPAADYPPDMAQKPADRCSHTGRAVIVRGGKVALSDVLRERIGFCPEIAPDEKYYYGVAHFPQFSARTAVN